MKKVNHAVGRGTLQACRRECRSIILTRMTPAAPFPTVTTTKNTVTADTVFAALGDSTRRRILLAMADGKPRTATAVTSFSGKRFDATLKHLIALRNAGLIVAFQDAVDGRRQAYTLAPSTIVTDAPEGKTMDFGYCLVRF